jgi:hypothetical protein
MDLVLCIAEASFTPSGCLRQATRLPAMDDFDDYDREAELALYKEYRDVVSQFQFVVETERRFYLANDVTQVVRERGNDFYFELTLNDVWVWDIYRSDRFVSSVKVLTFKDVNVEELGKKELKLPKDLALDE